MLPGRVGAGTRNGDGGGPGAEGQGVANSAFREVCDGVLGQETAQLQRCEHAGIEGIAGTDRVDDRDALTGNVDLGSKSLTSISRSGPSRTGSLRSGNRATSSGDANRIVTGRSSHTTRLASSTHRSTSAGETSRARSIVDDSPPM